MIEIWGGVECTVNRIGDLYSDQLIRSGHHERIEDLELFASLGIQTLRYPILWERTMQNDQTLDWAWADQRLAEIQRLQMNAIVGLVHHGSGPPWVDLLDEQFAVGLAEYGRKVAERYPWIMDYSPVNEPLTTARFSGLYGHWYPHRQTINEFARALLIECKAIALTMRAIREVNPHARLIQTEDLGKTYSTPHLCYQADFENERRWITYDLLCGKVDCHHPMRHYLRYAGISNEDIDWFTANTCPPDVIGINYYVTSLRFLDERLERYPPWTHGGNERQSYADIEAIRVLEPSPEGLGSLLAETWERYRLPIAVTECHLGSTPDEQMRWLWESYQTIEDQRHRGVDVRALTIWALLGAYDWNSLLTCDKGHYEPGVFALEGSPAQPVPTPLAEMVSALTHKRDLIPIAARAPGWWKRPERLLYPPVSRETGEDIFRDRKVMKPLSAGRAG